MKIDEDARDLIERLGLTPHPEGGFYRETYRAELAVDAPRGPRAASTAIYMVLPAGAVSALHRVSSDEIWHHYDGDAVAIHLLSSDSHEVVRLGRNFARGERPQVVVPAGCWQAALAIGPRYALCGCTVAPGFDFEDFELPTREALLERMPAQRAVIERLAKR